MEYIVEDFIEAANKLPDRETLFDYYIQTLGQFGFDTAIYTFATDHLEAGEKAGHALLSNFPSDWLDHYFENGYESLDPVVELAHRTNDVFTWADIKQKMNILPQQARILNEAEESGLHSGIGIPLHGARGELAGIGLAGDDAYRDFSQLELAQVQIITQQFHQKYCAFGQSVSKELPKFTLKERDVLQWMAAGKSAYDTSMIMGISQDTVKFHRKNIYQKLNANSLTYAIVKSLRLGLISLDKLKIT